MKNWFKFCLTCLGIAIVLRLAFEAVTGQSVEMPKAVEMPKVADRHAYIMPGKVAVEWHFQDEFRVWLSINSYSRTDEWEKDGYNPSFVYIRCRYIPMVKKLKDGTYQITFTSELTKNLP
jgi:hypothetical protein